MSERPVQAGMVSTIGLSGLLGHAAVYWAGVMLSKMLAFLMIPIYTHHLMPSDYGTLELIALTTDVMALIVGARITSAVFRFYHATDDEDERRHVLATALTAIMIGALVFLVIASLFAGSLATLLFGSPDRALLLRIVFITTALQLVQEIAMAELRIREHSRLFVGITLTHVVLVLSGSILLVAGLHMGVLGALLASAIASAIVAPFVIGAVLRRVGFGLHIALLRRMLAYSVPLIPAAIGLFVLHFADRYILNLFVGLEAVGIYALAYKFGFLISTLIAYPFGLIWGNRMHILYRDPDRDRLYNQVLSGYAVVLVGAGLGLSLFIDEVLAIISPEIYHAAAGLVPIIAAGYVLAAMNQLSMGPLYAEGRTGWVALATMIAAATNVALNFLLVPLYGALGAALATLAAFATLAAVTQYLAVRASPMRWDYRRAIAPLVLGVILVGVGRGVTIDDPLTGLGFKLLVFASYPLLLLAIRAVPPADLAEFRGWLRRRVVPGLS